MLGEGWVHSGALGTDLSWNSTLDIFCCVTLVKLLNLSVPLCYCEVEVRDSGSPSHGNSEGLGTACDREEGHGSAVVVCTAAVPLRGQEIRAGGLVLMHAREQGEAPQTHLLTADVFSLRLSEQMEEA